MSVPQVLSAAREDESGVILVGRPAGILDPPGKIIDLEWTHQSPKVQCAQAPAKNGPKGRLWGRGIRGGGFPGTNIYGKMGYSWRPIILWGSPYFFLVFGYCVTVFWTRFRVDFRWFFLKRLHMQATPRLVAKHRGENRHRRHPIFQTFEGWKISPSKKWMNQKTNQAKIWYPSHRATLAVLDYTTPIDKQTLEEIYVVFPQATSCS